MNDNRLRRWVAPWNVARMEGNDGAIGLQPTASVLKSLHSGGWTYAFYGPL